jgi:hypothetical protein
MSTQYALRKDLGSNTISKISGIIGSYQNKTLKTDKTFTTIAFQADVNAYFGTILHCLQEEVKVLFDDAVFQTLDETIENCIDTNAYTLGFILGIFKRVRQKITISDDQKSGTEFNIIKDMIRSNIKNQVDNMHIINEITLALITYILWIIKFGFLRLEVGIEKKTKLSLTMKMLNEIIPIVLWTINMFDEDLVEMYNSISQSFAETIATKPAPKSRKKD